MVSADQPEEFADGGKAFDSRAQDALRLVLRQAVVLLEEIWPHHLAATLREPVLAHEIAVRRHASDRVAGRQEAGCPQLIDASPKVKVLERALGEGLPFGYPPRRRVALHQRTRNTALPQLDSERNADGPSAHNDHLVTFFQSRSLSVQCWFNARHSVVLSRRSCWDESASACSNPDRASTFPNRAGLLVVHLNPSLDDAVPTPARC